MAHTDHHSPAFRDSIVGRTRRTTNRHSHGVSLANRGAGAHFYRDENGRGEKTVLRRRARRLGRSEVRAALAADLY